MRQLIELTIKNGIGQKVVNLTAIEPGRGSRACSQCLPTELSTVSVGEIGILSSERGVAGAFAAFTAGIARKFTISLWPSPKW